MVLRDNLFGTPEEDALRRDFTINAFAYNIADLSVIDYFSGLADLKQAIIRTIGDPEVRFAEDPVRMLRAIRFAASHGFTIEPDAWETIRRLAGTITRASPARLYEEIQKVFLLRSARPALGLLERSGLLAALFPDLSRWISEGDDRLAVLTANLAFIDDMYGNGAPPSLTLLFAALFGPSLEEEALSTHREGVPYLQALEGACAAFMKEVSRTVSTPTKVGTQLRSILALQQALHRKPPRRPAATVQRPEFSDALAYLRMTARTRREFHPALEWWEAFVLEGAAPPLPAPELAEAPPKKRRRRRRRSRPATAKEQ
jgi:poly(A) polymerase